MSVSASAARDVAAVAPVLPSLPIAARSRPRMPDDLAGVGLVLFDHLAQLDQGVVCLVTVCARRDLRNAPLYLGKERDDLGNFHALGLGVGFLTHCRRPGRLVDVGVVDVAHVPDPFTHDLVHPPGQSEAVP